MRPWTEKAESRFPPGGRLVEFLASVVLVSGMMVLSIGVMIFGIGFGVWLGLGEYDRVNFAIAEGSPFFVLATLFFIAAFGISRFQLWAWWLGLLGSIGGLAHGVYRFFLSPAVPPWVPPGANQTWLSSSPGALFTMVFGAVDLVLLLGAFRSFRQQVSEKGKGAPFA